MESQPKNCEFRINPENFHPYIQSLMPCGHGLTTTLHSTGQLEVFWSHMVCSVND